MAASKASSFAILLRSKWVLAAMFAILLIWAAFIAERYVADISLHGAQLHIAKATFVALVVLPVLTTVSITFRFIRWQFLLRAVRVRVPVRPSLSIYCAGLLGIATPGYVGEVLRGFLLKRSFKVPLRRSVPPLVLERIVDIGVIALISLVASGGERSLIGWSFLALSILGVAVFWLGLPYLGFTPYQRRKLLNLRVGVLILSLSLASWIVAALLVFCAALSVGVILPVTTGAAIFADSTLLGGLSMSPAGIGVNGRLAMWWVTETGVSVTQAIQIVTLTRLFSTGLALVLGAIFLWREMRTQEAAPTDAAAHFDDIAGEYSMQWSPHVWDALINRKLKLMCDHIGAPGSDHRGLDMGCGLGMQTAEMCRRGYDVTGMDPSVGLLEHARRLHPDAKFVVGSALELPFPDASFDFVYTIGVVHHLPGTEAQRQAVREIERVLKPGGMLLVHESNPRNPLFKFYMSYLFPLLKSIDDGTEHFVDVEFWRSAKPLTLKAVSYFTFLPDFMPRFLMKLGGKVEGRLETSRMKPLSAHYMAVLTKG